MKKTKKAISTVVAICLVLACFAGCSPNTAPGNNEATTPVPAVTSPDMAYKDTLVYSHNTDITTLNPNIQNGTNTEAVALLCYNTLLKFDENFEVIGDLAESWEVADDNITWTFRLRHGVQFHNGKEMTADDFKATYDFYMNPSNGFAVASLRQLTEVRVEDDYTLVLVTKEPFGVMERTFCDIETAVLDADYLEKYGSELGNSIESVNGTGPYKPAKWVKDSAVTLERFENYFGEKGASKTIVMQVIPEAASAAIALETGEVDVANGLTAEDVARLKADEDNFTIVKRPTVNQRLFRFGCNDEVISNPLVRQAIIYAIDRQPIIDGLFPGLVEPATCSVPPLTFGYKDMGVIEQDQEKAKQLLSEAGYPDGFTTKICTTERYEKGVQIAEVLASQLEEVGIKAEIEVIEWAAFQTGWQNTPRSEFDMPMFIMGGGYGSADCDAELHMLFGDFEDETARKNYGFYHNDEVSGLLDKAAVTIAQDERLAMYNRVNEILYLEDPGAIWLFDQYQILSTRKGVTGFTYLPNSVVNLAWVKAPK